MLWGFYPFETAQSRSDEQVGQCEMGIAVPRYIQVLE